MEGDGSYFEIGKKLRHSQRSRMGRGAPRLLGAPAEKFWVQILKFGARFYASGIKLLFIIKFCSGKLFKYLF